MNHRLNLHPRFIILTIVLGTVTHLSPVSSQDTDPFTVCNQTVRCGGLEFDYPFWGLARPAYCGHPRFELTCLSNVPILRHGSLDYRVRDIDMSTQTITVARNDLWSTLCPQTLYNTTLDSSVLNWDNIPGQENLSMYYGCDTRVTPPLNTINRFICNRDSDGYFTRTDLIEIETGVLTYFVECDNHIIVPVDRSWADRFARVPANESDLRSALVAGFNLLWTANNDLCDRCVESDGKCGSNSGSNDSFACYCDNGNFSRTCNDANAVRGEGKLFSLTCNDANGDFCVFETMIFSGCQSGHDRRLVADSTRIWLNQMDKFNLTLRDCLIIF